MCISAFSKVAVWSPAEWILQSARQKLIQQINTSEFQLSSVLIIATNINSRHNKACAHERKLYTHSSSLRSTKRQFFSFSHSDPYWSPHRRVIHRSSWSPCVSADAAEIKPRKVHEFVGNSLPEKANRYSRAAGFDKHKLLSALPCCRKNRAACLSREYNLIYYSGTTFLFNKKSPSPRAHTHTRLLPGKSKFLKTRALILNISISAAAAFSTHTCIYAEYKPARIHAQHSIFASALSGCRFIVFIVD